MNIESENKLLRKKLEDILENLEGAQLNSVLYFLIGMTDYLLRSSGAGTQPIPPTPIEITCPSCGHKF
jgi:hypothetical protein